MVNHLELVNIYQLGLFNVHVSKKNRGLTGTENVDNLVIPVALDLTKFISGQFPNLLVTRQFKNQNRYEKGVEN